MIKSIDVQNFGSFKNFIWRDSVRDGGNILEFKRLNILYGRNYSGKTTLSRILRSFQVHKLPAKYTNPNFAITTDIDTLNQTKIGDHTHDIRVYNTDFVANNLSFLNNHEEGEIKTFAIIGGENNELKRQIAEKEAELGSVESESGLKSKHARKSTEYLAKLQESKKAREALEERLRRHANGVIKINRDYGAAGYNLRSIQEDIGIVRAKTTAILVEDQKREKYDLLKEVELPDIVERLSFLPQIESLCNGLMYMDTSIGAIFTYKRNEDDKRT